MEAERFDLVARAVGSPQTRRGALALLGGAAAWPLHDVLSVAAKKKRKKKNKKKRKQKNKKKACTPQCAGCGGGDGCGGTCGCGANQLCDAGTCRTCDVTCMEDAVACGARLNQRLQAGGTVYVCPGRYQANLSMPAGKLIGAGSGSDPATSTILDGGGARRVVTVESNADVELMGLRIMHGDAGGATGGGVRSQGGELRITRCVIEANTAQDGGGVWVKGPFQITGSTISGNTVPGIGGGLLVFSDAGDNGFITDSAITGNTASQYGGGIYKFASPLAITNSTISGNHAGLGGGALQMSGGSVTFNSSSKVNQNTAPSGGLAHGTGGTVVLNGAEHTGNSTPECTGVTCS
ncbi:MAG: hypothetical protein KC442_18820 [Thermomicrobiales bacterium]|nr:hypothetical protein [Thermomicrobiales bacterium]